MTEHVCDFADRDELIVAYLYDDIDRAGRDRFKLHLGSCAHCRAELAALEGVRSELARWSPPEPVAFIRDRKAPAASRQTWLWEIPIWAQVAAAMLFLGVGAGIANLDVHYDGTGVTVSTGWSRPASPAPGVPGVNVPAASSSAAPWRAELRDLEQRLRADLRQPATTAANTTNTTNTTNAATPANLANPDLLRRVRAMLDESEKRQQRELALRLADVMRDVDTQRRADLVKIDRNLGVLQNNTGVEVLKQRELLNYLVRVSQNK